MLTKSLRWLIYGGLFAITLTPLIVTPSSLIHFSTFFPFITGKNFYFRIIVELIFGAWLILAYLDSSARPKKSWILWSLGAYLLIESLATILGENPTRSFWSNFERMEGLVAYVHSFLFFLVLSSVFKTKEIWRRFLKTSLGISLIISYIGYLQLFGRTAIHQSGSRLDATLGNSAYLAVYILFHIFFSAYLLVTSRNKTAKWIYGVIIALESIVLYYTATRGAILGLVGGIILGLILMAWHKKGNSRRVALSVLGSVFILVALFISFRDTAVIRNNQVLSRFASLSFNDSSILARKQIWVMGLKGSLEHPLLGWGPENFPLVFQKYYTPQMWGQEAWFDRSHNIVLDNLINAGVLGLLSYISIFAAALYYLWRAKKDGADDYVSRIILVSLLAGYFFQNLTVFDQLISTIFFMVVLGLIHFHFTPAVVAEKPIPVKKHSSDQEAVYLPAVVLAVVLVTSFSIYYFNWRGLDIASAMIRAISPQTPPAQALAEFEDIFSHSSAVGLTEAREQLINLVPGKLSDPNLNEEVKQKYFSLIMSEMEKQFALEPNDARQRLFYGTFLSAVGNGAAAIEELEKARQLSPRKQMILFQLGITYIGVGETEKGLQVLKQAHEEEPAYPEARKLYALAALYSNRPQLAEEILGPEPLTYITDDRFISYYQNNKQFDKVIQIWQVRLASNPKDKNANIGLASAYYYSGNRAKAIEVLKNYIKLEPSFATEGESLIKAVELGQIK